MKYDVLQKDFYKGDLKIDGQLFLPDQKRSALLIISHGFGGNRSRGVSYAKLFASKGIAVYVYDFIGGGPDIKSDGDMLHMSVLTEADDLRIILDGLLKMDYIDSKNVFLSGRSQGGYVSTLVASDRKEEIRGMVLLYPAYVIQDHMLELIKNGKQFEKEFEFLNNRVSDLYGKDAVSVDIFEKIREYDEDVLIIHGDADDIVPIRYSYEAVKTFPHARLEVIEGAGHGFEGEDDDRAKKLTLDFVLERLI